LQLVKKQTEE